MKVAVIFCLITLMICAGNGEDESKTRSSHVRGKIDITLILLWILKSFLNFLKYFSMRTRQLQFCIKTIFSLVAKTPLLVSCLLYFSVCLDKIKFR